MATKPIDSKIIFEMPAVAAPAIRPDGATIAYVRSQVDGNSMEGDAKIELVRFGGGEPRTLTAGPADSYPRWSPDGSTLAFLRSERTNKGLDPAQLCLLPGDGGEARRVTDLPSAVVDFAWTPDGRKLVCVSDVDPDRREDGDDAIPRVREVRRVYYRADTIGWRGDAHRQLFLVDVDGDETRQVTRGDYDCGLPVFSPNGRMLAFVTSDRSATRNAKPRGDELCVMRTDRRRRQSPRVLVRRMQIGRPAWSPDGSEIAFVGSERVEEAGGYGERTSPGVYAVNVRRGTARRLTDDCFHPRQGSIMFGGDAPVWANRRLYFVADARASSGLYSITPSGSGLRAERNAAETIVALSMTPDASRAAFVSTTPQRPPEVATLDLQRGRAGRVTSATQAYSETHPPADVERFTVRRGGVDIDCWLMFPPNFDPSRRYPLVLEIHGGPNGAFMTAFMPLHQSVAGAGSLVLYVNPGGSTTYGADFTSRVLGDWGGEDYLDLMAALDTVCRRPYVNERRLGVHGYSYGGYMASWVVGHTDRFKAAVVGAPVINLLSMWGTTDIGVTFGEEQWGGRPHRNLDWYIERSPLTYADRVQTPVLLMHGEADVRCPISQSEEYFTALKRQGKTVEFVRFPDCSHLFLGVGHPAMRREYFDRTVAWFKRWL
ncbi:MAG TPA: S9 family peptidase [Dehalococcoidia bacterium]|nr:S9 family peptidase [Dehalococcoidia bacterium]